MKPITIIQTPTERHIENRIYGRYRRSEGGTLCARFFGLAKDVKRIDLDRIPTAAVCPRCVETARRWYSPDYFEPFDTTQRWRLLSNLDRDLAAVA